MKVVIPEDLLKQIHEHGQMAYPEEGAGLLFGLVDGDYKRVKAILELMNAREAGARYNRYLITPQDMLRGENQADSLGLEIIGVFHSHPDHSNRPSEFDRDWAMPWYSYVITSVDHGKAIESRSWQLVADRSNFVEEEILSEKAAE